MTSSLTNHISFIYFEKKMGRLYEQLKKKKKTHTHFVLALLFSCQKCICRILCCLGLCIHSLMQTHLCSLILAREIRGRKRNYVCSQKVHVCRRHLHHIHSWVSGRPQGLPWASVTGPTDKVHAHYHSKV